MKNRIFTFLLLGFLLTSGTVQAQQDENYEPMESRNSSDSVIRGELDKKWDWSKARIGGNFGLQFGDITYIDISPSFGYYVLEDKLQVGVGFKNVFYNQKNAYVYYYNGINYYSPPYKTYLYGPSIFAQYTVWRGLFVHGEYELINKEPYNPADTRNRINVSHLLLGAGYTQPIGRAGNFYISMLYNVLDSEESIYDGTFGRVPLILRMGFGFGIPGR